MNVTDANKTARRILKSNKYLTLGTTDGRRPWIAPLYYCRGPKNVLYVISQPHSRHIRNSATHPAISFAIFDSHAPEGTGNGIQATGILKCCTGKERTEALRYYHTDFISLSETMLTNGPYRMYRIIPKTMYILDSDAPVDKRIRVQP